MPQSYTQLHYHLVFSTKQRQPAIVPDIRQRLWDYLGGIVRGEGGIPILIGGMPDHVHVLATLRQNLSLAEFMKKLKGANHRIGYTRPFPILRSGGRRDTEPSR